MQNSNEFVKDIQSLFQPNKKKNIKVDVFGTRKGRIHMTKQHLDKMQTRKMKGLKKSKLDKTNEEAMEVDSQEHEQSDS